jgi:ubiquinone/menaquinone biosynthesis C-methylase UbiE
MGVKEADARLRALVARVAHPSPRVLDVGGGTGNSVELWPHASLYSCLEPDAAKLVGYRRRFPEGVGIQGDGTRLPFPSATFDVVMCRAVSHHLTAAQFDGVLREAARVVGAGGHLLFFDALVTPRVRSRLLWMVDRGRNPRDWDQLQEAIGRTFEITASDRFTVQHEYAAFLARPL